MKINLLLFLAFLATALSSYAQGHDHEHEAIVLNEGEKWKVDDNMMIHLKKMAVDVEAAGDQESKDFETLHKQLAEGITALTSNCTMTGQAHDELHKWLVPFIGTANGYDTEMTAKQKQEWLQEVQNAMTVFNLYFQ